MLFSADTDPDTSTHDTTLISCTPGRVAMVTQINRNQSDNSEQWLSLYSAHVLVFNHMESRRITPNETLS